jgi:hypothetical protein
MARGRIARVGGVFAITLLIAALTALVFLIRAGDPGASNWPTDFELRSSDNGVLFQFAQDVFAGRHLDWSFSPQVFVFPEIPISLVGYLLAGGTVQLYYLMVAAINNALLFLGLFAVLRYLFPMDAFGRRAARAAIAAFPLLFLPLLGATPLLTYQLAPTYYYGMYLAIVVAPTLLLARACWVRVLIGAGLALTVASNPLTVVFTLPAVVLVLLVLWTARGFRAIAWPAVWIAGVLVVALLVRLLLFSRLQGGSPFAYVDTTVFSGRMAAIIAYAQSLLAQPVTASVVVAGAVVAIAGLAVACVLAVRMVRSPAGGSRVRAAAIYYALVPVTGLAATFALIITDYLYLWPVLIAPLVFVLLPLPRAWVPPALPIAAGAFVLTALLTGAVPNLVAAGSYFHYRSAETQCLDAKLPIGDTIGYATFSDARRIELTSRRPFRLIQLKSSGVRAYWLTNRDYARERVGRFFYINAHGDEPPISVSYLEKRFGMPDGRFSCGPGQTVLLYNDPAKLAKIKARYSTLPAP